ncbi:MAG: hypothetical protein JNK85_16205, partial [Verrucomicrobiales bacterium]|nr:hypothetical protein [Verrucomicrobiales bacterium]
ATFDLRAGEVRLTAEGRFENYGRLTHDAATPALLAGVHLDNFGRLEVDSGQLDLRGASTHFGVVRIASGATLRFGNGAVYSLPTDGVRHFFAPSSRLEGAGNLVVWEAAVHFAGPVDATGLIQFESSRGSITFAGVTRLRRGLNLAGEFSNPFVGNRRGNDVTFSGLSAQIDQPVVMGTNSALTFDQAVPTQLTELDAGQGSRVQGKGAFSVLGKSRLDSASLFGSGPARFVGPTEFANLTVQGPNAPAAPKVVEFDGETSTKGTHFFRQTLLRVGTHGTLALKGGEAWRRNSNPGLVQMENLGLARHSGSGTTSFDFGFVNRGQFEVLGGEIVFPVGNGFIQEAGVTTLRSGTLKAEPIVRGGVFRLESGQLTGALTFFDGQLEFPPNATLPVELRVSGGILDLPESTLTVGLIRHTNGMLRLNGGTLGSLGYAGQNPAVLTGHGTFDTRGGGSGEVRPGSPLGILEFTGSYSLDNGSRFVAEIGGLTPGTGFDQLRTSDLSVSSSATLDLRLVGGFSPPLGAEFPIIVVTNGRRAPRAFGTVEGLAIGTGKRFEVVYEVAGVKLRVVAAP